MALLAVAGYIGSQVFGGNEPPAVALSSASPSTSGSISPNTSAGFDGTWSVDATSGSLTDGSSTFAGYRIEEQVASVGAHTAVGRTQQVSGSMTIDGTKVTSMDLTVDMSTLQSDDDRRDGQLVDRGIQTATFPTATFTLTQPVDIGSTPNQGQEIDATVTGDLALHGVTKQVEVPVQAQWTGDRIEVVASFDVSLADYQIEAPTGFSVLSIADTGTVELHVLFQKE